ncbi:MAG TPA: penicillin acylase family protein [Micromonosporaceae bacterium]|nr:penicillin acylase family protein [Micromonosporaceae bacterium]
MRPVRVPWPRVGRIALWTLAVVTTLAVVLSVLGVWAVRRSFPQYGGTLALPGLSAPVTVHRDPYGIPHVYAKTAEDLFRAQGFLHAQDRFWEMDFRRHVTGGRTAELFGADQVETDAYLRTMGWRRVAEQELARISTEARVFLAAYADGVNSWLDEHDGGAASLEYTLLGLTNSGYEIEPWHPVDSLAWLKAMAWDLRSNMESEITRAALLGHGLSRQQVDELYPAYPYDRNLPIVTGGTVVGGAFDQAAAAAKSGGAGGSAGEGTGASAGDGTGGSAGESTGGSAGGTAVADGYRSAVAALDQMARGLSRLPAMLGAGDGIGSNSWVLSGRHTVSGKPILANDPHLSPSMPGIWYQMGLHCECDFNVVGFSFSGVPGVVIGHNARVAWGFTNLGPDVSDLYLERVEGDRYLVDGQWHEMERRQEVLRVAGGDPVTITVRSTRHGPLLSDASETLREIAAKPPSTAPGQASGSGYGIALRWTALDPGRTIEALFTIDRATSWAQARAAAELFEVPAQNIVYADIDGNIGYQAPGRIPIRGKGDGRWPAPGWDSAYDWRGYIPFSALPSVYNPERGYLVTANQAVVGPQYPYLISHDWAYGTRSQRIHDLLGTALAGGGKLSAPDVARMQLDARNGMAAAVVPVIAAAPVSGTAAKAVELLRGWDYQQPADGARGTSDAARSAAAAYYNAFWRALLARLFDEIPDDYAPEGSDRSFEVVRTLLANPASPWWDDRRTPSVETADQILSAALTAAADELRRAQGDDPADWRWGRMHLLTLEHQTFGSSGIGPIEWLFNRGPAGTSGGPAIVNANGWHAGEGYQVNAVPSMRMVVDLSNLDGSRWVQLTGNSGHAFHPNYWDQFELWRTGQTLPMRWDRATIQDEAAETLTLRPARGSGWA